MLPHLIALCILFRPTPAIPSWQLAHPPDHRLPSPPAPSSHNLLTMVPTDDATLALRAALRAAQERARPPLAAAARLHDATVARARLLVQRVVRARPHRMTDDYMRGGAELLAAAGATVALVLAVRAGLLRYHTAEDIPAALIRRGGVLHGCVVAVRDGDGVRVRHVPLLRRLLRGYMPPRSRGISHATINVRLAGVDAPECVSFGRKGQTYGPIARDWLRHFVVGEKVSVRLHSMDQYRRVVGTVYKLHANPLLRVLGIGRKNLSLELTKAGYATLYEGAGAQYGGENMRRAYVRAEAAARRGGLGMWAQRGGYVSPAEYKRAARTASVSSVDTGIVTRSVLRAVRKGQSKGSPRASARRGADEFGGVLSKNNTARISPDDEKPKSFAMTIFQFARVSYDYLKQFRK